MYSVVQFVEDDALAVVHSTWFVAEDMVQWPGVGRSNLVNRLLRQGVKLPNHTPVYKIRKLADSGEYIILKDIIFRRSR